MHARALERKPCTAVGCHQRLHLYCLGSAPQMRISDSGKTLCDSCKSNVLFVSLRVATRTSFGSRWALACNSLRM